MFSAAERATTLERGCTLRERVKVVSMPQNTVAIFEAPRAAEGLRKGLTQIYRVVCGASWANGQSAFTPMPLAAIIGAVEDPFALCASLPDDLPKLLMTADCSFALRQKAVRAGIEAVISRPFLLNELLSWLEQFELNRNVAPISVLLIDDDVVVAGFHAEALQGAGMLVDSATHAADAISVLEKSTPDLILMDINMPGTDGIELAQMIRQTRRHLSVPIVFLSGERDEDRQMAARQSGSSDIIAKPIDAAKLVHLVTLRAQRARALRSMIERDSLTGLLSHGHFIERAGAALSHCRRANRPCSLAMIDIDHFKTINDHFGHPAGDHVIRTLSRGLLARAGTADVVGRCGGEEFGILLSGSAIEAAHAIIDQVRVSFGAVTFGEEESCFTTSFSAGLAAGPTMDLQMLVRAADEALYAAKLKGRDRVERSHMPAADNASEEGLRDRGSTGRGSAFAGR